MQAKLAQSFLGKYREIVIAIGCFLLLVLAALAVNFYASFQIAEDAAEINLAGRQRMLSQRVTKALFEVESLQAGGKTTTDAAKELKSSAALFDATLRAFNNGGTIAGAAGKDVLLKAVSAPAAQTPVKQAAGMWSTYQGLLDQVMNVATPTEDAIRKATEFARANNLKLLDLMNTLTVELENEATQRAGNLRMLQLVFGALALLIFFYIIFKAIRTLKANDAVVEARERENVQILSNVREGLFLLDKDGKIGSQMSNSLSTVMGRTVAPGMDFLGILRELVPQRDLDSAKEYMDLLFGDRVKESLVTSLNPLNQLELRGDDGAGGTMQRYVSMQFSRVKSGKETTNLLVTAQDITERVQLMQAVKEAEARAQEEVKGLLDLLELEPAVSRRFLQETETSLDAINDHLREAGHSRDYPSTVNEIFKRVHKLKGDSAMYKLSLFETLAHRFENLLDGLRSKSNLNGDDLLAIPPHLEDIYGRVSKLRSLAERMTSKDAHITQAAASGNELGFSLEALANKVAGNQKKKVRVTADLPEFGLLPEGKANMLRDIAVQLVRNAIVHGIEPGDERVMSSKTETGSIHVTLKRVESNRFEFVVRDDGRGIIPEQIRESMVRTGRYSRAEADALDDRTVVMKLFEPGVTTSAAIDEDSGRGVGLDLVAEKVKSLGAQIRLGTRPNTFTQFSIAFAA
jgi:two-component system, chemotaxis family, sensor kinase CheA